MITTLGKTVLSSRVKNNLWLSIQDSGIPGYLPKELFAGLSDAQLQAVVCQRCHFLREYDMALSVSVDPQLYPKLLSQLRRQMALVILVVDMTDFPCSIWPGILDVIGTLFFCVSSSLLFILWAVRNNKTIVLKIINRLYYYVCFHNFFYYSIASICIINTIMMN